MSDAPEVVTIVVPPPRPPRNVKKWLLFFGALIGILGIAWGILFTYFAATNRFPIKIVKVIGVYQYVNQTDIQNTLQPFLLGKGLFAFSELRAEKALEQIPGVATASIWRVPPSKLRVIIRERSAIARLADGDLLASDGVAFPTTNPAGTVELPLLVGNPLYAKQMLEMLESLQPVFDTIQAKVTGLGLASNGDWSIQINNQTWIIMGKGDLGDRAQDFLSAYPVLMKTAVVGATLNTVDLRYAHGFTASWTAPPAATTASS